MRELTINLNLKAETPLYEQIYHYIKQDIQDQKILAGEKLPSSRALSRYLEVSRSTVDLAYGQLLSEGYVESIPCKGYYACQIEGLYHLKTGADRGESEPKTEEKRWKYDFTPNGIDLDGFPYGVWRKVTRNVLLDDRKELFQLGDPKGEWELRETISRYLHQARGVNCRPEQVVLGAGNDYLMMLIAAILGKRKLAMESPTYKHAYGIFEKMGFELCTVPVDASGMRVDELTASGADVAYVMPSHQYPLGIVMPIKRRLELLKWAAEKEDRYLIEDDYDSEFRYASRPIPALGELDRTGRVVYVNTFAKSLAPGLRIGYLVLPNALMARYRERFSRYSSTVPSFDQYTLAAFMHTGGFERHISRSRKVYQARRDALMAALDRELADLPHEVSRSEAGLHLLLHMRNGMLEHELIERAKASGVRVYPLSAYYTPPVKPPRATLVLGYAGLTEQQIDEAAKLLKQAWS